MECGRKMVRALQCSICSKYKSRIESSRNFNDKWIVGAESLRTSNIRDHGKNNQHVLAMSLLEKEHATSHGEGPSTYAPIVQALTRLPENEKARLKRKFDIAYLVATESMLFLKYPVICQLEKKHELDIGVSYTNECSGRPFVHYIAEARRKELAEKVVSAKFYSLLIDGSTDKGNIDNEAVLTVWCDPNCSDEKVYTRISYLALIRPKFVTGEGLFEVLGQALSKLEIEEVDGDHCQQLIGIGTDGTSTNIANAGLKGIVESKLEWIVWMWCLAHRLELGIKDVLILMELMTCYFVYIIYMRDHQKNAVI